MPLISKVYKRERIEREEDCQLGESLKEKMEDVFPVGQESLEDKHKKNNAGVENDNHYTLSESKLDREHVASKLPLILDIKRPERCRRCCQLHKSCSCTSQFVLSDSFDFSGGTHAADFGLETLPFFCRKSSSLTLPGLKSNSRQQRKSRSIHSVTDLVAECSPVARSGNVVPSPSNRRVFDSIEATLRSRALTKSSVILGTASPDDGMRRVRTKSISLSDTKSPESISFHSGLQNSTSGSPRMVATPCRRRSSELSISQEMPSSCSDTSYQTDSSAGFNSALLHCVWEDGNPYFVFSVGEDQADVYMASPHKTKSSADKALDYIYLFHAWKKNRKKSEFHLHSGSKFVAKMKVRSSLVLNSSRAKFVESEFVLSAAKEDSFNEMQRSSPCFTKSKGMTGRLSEVLRRSHRYKSNSIKRVGGGSSSQVEDLPQRYASELGIIDDIPHNLELAAIVVQDFGCQSKHLASFDGWGLKFLEKAGTDSSRGPPSSSATCKENYTQHMNTGRNVSVLLPAGFHGGPMARAGGPSSLTERWRSNGHCDCGGWDVGCPLTILSNDNSIYSKGLAETEDDCKPLSLFIEGAKQDGLDFSFRMFSMSRDIYIVCFQPTLSALQSFSIGVAMIHSQSSDLCPQW
ncbi:hypothetical protein MUK42_18063 [Musa troglodytarum]|uniref:Uncharacterized protein n=1 Tax=Musa troglodytarum TaxID=320322 RepID=A0A9E7KXM3_9LILI|nr:hypothetical protein MUK42_18063 [Musa troglodytarum]